MRWACPMIFIVTSGKLLQSYRKWVCPFNIMMIDMLMDDDDNC